MSSSTKAGEASLNGCGPRRGVEPNPAARKNNHVEGKNTRSHRHGPRAGRLQVPPGRRQELRTEQTGLAGMAAMPAKQPAHYPLQQLMGMSGGPLFFVDGEAPGCVVFLLPSFVAHVWVMRVAVS